MTAAAAAEMEIQAHVSRLFGKSDAAATDEKEV